MPSNFRDVDPRELRVPGSRPTADPVKLARQTARFGTSTVGMPPIIVYEASDGVLVIYDGMTRATRVATQLPGKLVRVEIIGQLKRAHGSDPKIGDSIP